MLNISATGNPKIKATVRLRESRRERDERSEFFLEGARLCADAALSGAEIKTAFFTEAARSRYPGALDVIIRSAGECCLITEDIALKLADVKSPQGVFCVCAAKDGPAEKPIDAAGRYIAFENLQNPGNLGAAARTAEAFGITGMIVCGGSDIYNPKAQRAAMGALLRLEIIKTDDLASLLEDASGKGMSTYAAVPCGDAVPVTDMASGGIIAVVGNEGAGLSEEIINACRYRLTIPMRGRAESLNAAEAAAVIMWEMTR